jgi:asparagine synthase (glutamine-hydrolysing)
MMKFFGGDKVSAIWGLINKNNNHISEKVEQVMVKSLSIYKLDCVKSWYKKNVYLGCGIQYITPESLKETLPYYNEEKGLAITADAIIDNREELFNLLNVSPALQSNITDSELILMSYEKWEKECPKHLLGDFAFAILDENKNELFCARDHVGKRTLYYYYSDAVFSFSTTIRPLLEVMDIKTELNERWISDFLSIDVVIHETECNETIYKDIYQLPPAYTLCLDKNGVRKENYWDPLKSIKRLQLSSDKEYDEAFIKIYSEAIKCRLRSNDEVGILLSGGLDSSSVACIAANYLKMDGNRLKGFTSIPMEGFNDYTTKRRIADESEYVKAIEDSYENIDVVYCRSEGKTPLTDIDRFISILEQPFKIVENLYWYDELTRIAADSKCKILLDGQFGNLTVSAGDFTTHALTLFREMKILTLLKEIKCYSSLNAVNIRRISKHVARVIMPYNIRKLVSKKINRQLDRFSKSPVNIKLIKKWNVEERLNEKGFNLIPMKFYDIFESNKFVVNPVLFSHMAALETKISLAHGIVKRDPTRDKRVIEFCLSLPPEQFVRNGQERHLIRRTMEGIIPNKIRLNTNSKGIQSADWIQRIIPRWNILCTEIRNMLEDNDINKYINTEKVNSGISSVGDIPNEKQWDLIHMLIIVLNFSYFIKWFSKENT